VDDRTQLGTRIPKDIKKMLAKMAADDLRSLSKELEHLIVQEHNRRNAPHHKLVDSGVEYVTEKGPVQ